MSKLKTRKADAAMVRKAIVEAIEIHPRVSQQDLALGPDAREKIADQIPPLVPYDNNRYAAARAVLDWDHQLPSQLVILRLYMAYTRREADRIERDFKYRAAAIEEDNLYPEFDVPDFGEIPAAETYIALMRPRTAEIHDLRFFSDWRKQVKPSLMRDALAAVRGHPGFERSLQARTHDHLGPPVVIGWAPPCLARSEAWAIEVWLLVDFDGHSGKAHVFMVDSKSKKVSNDYFTEVHLS